MLGTTNSANHVEKTSAVSRVYSLSAFFLDHYDLNITTNWHNNNRSCLLSPDTCLDVAAAAVRDFGGDGAATVATAVDAERGATLLERLHEVATFRASLLLVMWALPVVIGVGVAGNFLSLWVLLRRGMRRTSACRYLACLAVADTAVLLTSAFKTWVRVVWGEELLHVSPASCKLFIFFTHLSLTCAAWLIVAVTLERFLAVWLPLRASEVCSVGRTRGVIAGLLLTLGLINAHIFWTAELVPVPPRHALSSSGVQCASYAYETLACEVFPWVHLALYCFLPAGFLLVLNTLILVKLFQHRKALEERQNSMVTIPVRNLHHVHHLHHHHNQQPHQRKPLTTTTMTITKILQQQQQHGSNPLRSQALTQASISSSSSSSSSHQFHRRLAPMLLGISFAWLLLTTPQTIYNLAAPAPTSLEEMGRQQLVRTICFVLMYVNHALNFFLYCMTGQRFRQELRRVLTCLDRERRVHLKRTLFDSCAGNSRGGTGSSGNGEPGRRKENSPLDSGYPLMERKHRSRKQESHASS